MALRIIIYIDVLCVYYFQIIDSILCFRILFLIVVNVQAYGVKPHSLAYTLNVWSLMPFANLRFAYSITPYDQTL